MDSKASSHVTIVTGLPRSGTSLMMQMLLAGGVPLLTDAVRPADADNPRGYHEFEPVKQTLQDTAWLAGAAGKAVKVIHWLLPHLPAGCTYRVIFMHRDLGEVLASQSAMLQRQNREGANLTPAQLAAVFDRQLRQVRMWLASQTHCTVLDVDYHRIIDDPVGQAARVNAFLSGRLDEAKMAAAVDPGLYRQRSSAHRAFPPG